MNLARMAARWRLAAACAAVACGLANSAAAQSGVTLPPADLTLATKDGVQLKITYYASPDGQQAVPVVLLHDFNETRAVFTRLASTLQRPAPSGDGRPPNPIRPRAVITVDLRGHGESKTAFAPDGSPVELDASRFQTNDFERMVQFDMEAVRGFLVEQNDAGKLNLNKLCVAGCGMGANVAMLWTAKDWDTPPLAARKQGQDVKALALFSPRWNFRGLTLREPLQFPPIQRQISILLAYGAEDNSVSRDMKNVRKNLDKFHPEPLPDQAPLKKDYFVFDPETELQGSELLNSREFGMIPNMVGFVEARLGRFEYPYVKRKN